MRAASAAALLLLTAACGSADEPQGAPSVSTTTTSAPTSTSWPPLSPASFRATWEKALQVASPRVPCKGADAFSAPCVLAMDDFAATTARVSKAALDRSPQWSDVALAAIEVGNAARKWNTECVTEAPEVRLKRGCLQALLTANNGDERIIAKLYEAEQSG